MSVFVLTPDDVKNIQNAKQLALANIIPLEVVRKLAESVSSANGVISGNRPDNLYNPQEVVLTFNWRLNLSCEEQPNGLCLHISLSSPTPDKTLPRVETIRLIQEVLECGEPLHVWVENFKDANEDTKGFAGKAVNMLFSVMAKN